MCICLIKATCSTKSFPNWDCKEGGIVNGGLDGMVTFDFVNIGVLTLGPYLLVCTACPDAASLVLTRTGQKGKGAQLTSEDLEVMSPTSHSQEGARL